MDILTKIEYCFENMARTEKVDTAIISDLKKFYEYLTRLRNNISTKDATSYFSIFHAIETQIRIINWMIWRVDNAYKNQDNPRVADDALLTIPLLKLVYNAAQNKMSSPYYLMSISSNLQILAMKNNMYPPSEQVIKVTNKEMLSVNFNRFVANVGEEIERI